MKLRLIFMAFVAIPIAILGQDGVVFYSKANMYVGAQDGDTSREKTTLFINGSAKFYNSAEAIATPNTGSVKQEGVTEIKGDFVDAVSDGGYLFVKSGNSNGSGVVLFSSTDSIQQIYRPSSIFDANSKRNNHLNFPTVRIRQNQTIADLSNFNFKKNALLVDTAISMVVDVLDLTDGTYPNRFVAEASYSNDNSHSIKSAYVLINQLKDLDASNNVLGISQVNLALYDPNNEAGTNRSTARHSKLPESLGLVYKYLTGFTPPFYAMGNDYTYFQTVVVPRINEDGSLNPGDEVRTQPDLVLKGGKGYFLAMEVSRIADLENDIAKNWFSKSTLARKYRTLGTFNFARAYHNQWRDSLVTNVSPELSNFSLFANANNKVGVGQTISGNSLEKFVEERFVTEDVRVNLVNGTNFLGNPFMAPLDLKDIATSTSGTELQDFNVTVSDGSPGSAGDIINKFWLVNEAGVTFYEPYWKYYYTIKYYDSSQGGIGGTLYDDRYHVGPMQMFVLQARNTGAVQPITLPSKKRIVQSSVRTPRSFEQQRMDDFVFTLTNKETFTEDRTCIVLRDNYTATSEDLVESPKGIVKSMLKDMEENNAGSGFDSYIYTKSSDGQAMLTNALPTGTKEVALFVSSGNEKAVPMVIKPERTESMYSVREMWLHDKIAKKYVELGPDTEYSFISQPNETNRFSVIFGKIEEPHITIENDPISCYYNRDSELYLLGLNDGDINSTIDIYDMQGRQITKTVVKTVDDGSTKFPISLAQGTYIVKMKGKRNFTGKFISLQN